MVLLLLASYRSGFAVNDVGDSNVSVVDVFQDNRVIDVDPGDRFWLTVPVGSGLAGVEVHREGDRGWTWLKAGEFLPVQYDQPGEYTIRLRTARARVVAPMTVRVFAPPAELAEPKGQGGMVALASSSTGPKFSLGSVYAGLYENGATNKFPLRIVSQGAGDCVVWKYGGGWTRTYTFTGPGEMSDVVDVPAGQTWTLVKSSGGTQTLSTNSPSRLKVVDLILTNDLGHAPVPGSVTNLTWYVLTNEVVTLRVMPGPSWVTNNPAASAGLFDWTTNSVALPATTNLTQTFMPAAGSNLVNVACLSPNTSPTNQFTTIYGWSVTWKSRDRFVHGVIQVPAEMTNVAFRIQNLTSGQEFGPYSDISGQSPGFHRYEQEADIFSDAELEADSAGTLPSEVTEQPVVFVRDSSDPTKLHFYTVFDALGEIKATLTHEGDDYTSKHTLTNDTAFSELIDLLDERIHSFEIPVVAAARASTGEPLAATAAEAGGLRQRNLVTKTLISALKSINPQISFLKGAVNGIWDGLRGDWDSVVGIGEFIGSPVIRSSEIYHAFKVLGAEGIMGEVGQMIENSLSSLLSDAEKSVQWTFDQTDVSDAVAMRAYIMGYTMGFLSEQILLLKGIALAGNSIKGVLLTTKVGQVTLEGVTAVHRFRTATLRFANQFCKTEAMMQQMKAMAEALGKVQIGNKTAGEILANRVTKLNIVAEEISRYVNGKWDDIGYRAQMRLAHVMEAVLGEDLTEKAIRGFVRTYERLIVGNADRCDDLLKLMQEADGSTEKASLKQTLESAKDAFDNTPAGQRPRIYAKGMESVHSTTYRYVDDIGIIQNGKLPQHPGEGWYCSFDKFDDQLLARSELQLPTQNSARYRIEISTETIKDDIRIPYGKSEVEPFLEPKGAEGGTPVVKIFDLQTGQYIPVP
jgi:hypothetical protein